MTIEKLGLIFIFLFLFSSIFYFLQQPLLISYLLSGMLASHLFPLNSLEINFLESFSNLGLVFLLFLVGLQLNWMLLKEISRLALFIGVLQEVLTIILGIIFILFLGFDLKTSILFSIAFSFSSTAIVLKILSDKREIETFHGRLIIGFMLVQDIISLIAFAIIDILKEQSLASSLKTITFFPIFIFLAIFNNLILKKLENEIAKNLEYLFIFSLSYALGMIALGDYLNIGKEISALIAGLSLANLKISQEIISRLKSLRDFFLILFFIKIGLNFSFSDLNLNFLFKVICLSIFVIIFNPLIVMVIMRIFRFPLRVNFIVSLSSGQVSEFSFVFLDLLKDFNYLKKDLISLSSLVGFLTIFISTYLLTYYEKVYEKIKKYLKIFEVKERIIEIKNKNYEILLLGCDRIGSIILKNFEYLKDKILIIDFNPEIIKNLKEQGFGAIYGDASEVDLLEELDVKKIKWIISTIPDFQTNLFLIKYFKDKNKNLKIYSVASREEERNELEKSGADFVFIPYTLGGEYLANILKQEVK
ncbi:Inner membrane protein YbaL [bacterium HR35]|nr:Inner membrane protein YbaL [bacterium HR35]